MRTLIVGIDQSGRIVQHDRSSLETLAPSGESLLGAHLDDLVTAPDATGSPLNGLLGLARMLPALAPASQPTDGTVAVTIFLCMRSKG